MFSWLLGMQAAGVVIDYLGTQSQQRLGEMGAKIQQASTEANIYQTRLEAEDASLEAMKKLRQNLGTQAAVFAARGVRSGAGSALSFTTESMSNFNKDERMRRLNLMNRETALRSEGTISKLNQSAQNAKLWQGFASRTFQRLPLSYIGDKVGKTFGLTDIGS